jgi:hypothetical protein
MIVVFDHNPAKRKEEFDQVYWIFKNLEEAAKEMDLEVGTTVYYIDTKDLSTAKYTVGLIPE